MKMNATNIAGALPTDAFPRVQSSIRARLAHYVNSDILCEKVFIAITIGMAMFFSYVCYHALQNYTVM
jgi:hypothetical protein